MRGSLSSFLEMASEKGILSLNRELRKNQYMRLNHTANINSRSVGLIMRAQKRLSFQHRSLTRAFSFPQREVYYLLPFTLPFGSVFWLCA